MKHKLVPLFFWAALVLIVIAFTRDILDASFFTKWIAWLTGWMELLARLVLVFVGLRLLCELAIAIFRIADNTSKDGGRSDLADIDPLAETRRAAEEAAKRAREVTGKAVDATKSTASNLKDSAEKRFDRAGDNTAKPKSKSSTNPVEQVFDKPVDTPAPAPKPAAKKAAPKKAAPKKTAAKKTTTAKKATTKKPAAKKATTKKTTPKKKP